MPISDMASVVRGLQCVSSALVKLQGYEARQTWKNSSLRPLLQQLCRSNPESPASSARQETFSPAEMVDRITVVCQGMSRYLSYVTSSKQQQQYHPPPPPVWEEAEQEPTHISSSSRQSPTPTTHTPPHLVEQHRGAEHNDTPLDQQPLWTTAANTRQQLNERSREKRVPATRIGRLISYGGLAAGLGLGAAAEVVRRSVGLGEGQSLDNPFLTDANANRIVATLCQVRGAALKMGQMLSIQDSSVVSPQLQAVFERVRQSADFMPLRQMERVLTEELGLDWRSKLGEFETKPFAAASIGQVHRGRLHDGRDVAIKIQYPGVAKGINSDIDNLLGILKLWDILPRGMFVENLMVVARKELAWEVDYVREADCAQRFREFLSPHREFYVPEVILDLSKSRVLTTELISGISVDRLVGAKQALRDWLGEQILKLALLELFVFKFMQTDPNWSNFFYNQETNQLMLLDFGASREFESSFMDDYIRVIKAAADRDRDKVLALSTKLGFLTGYESKVMERAHLEAVMALGEPFHQRGPFDFGKQDTTRKVYDLVPIMLQHRLTPPPEESYSIHRKLSGIFLLCSKLGSRVDCQTLFQRIYDTYPFSSSSS